MDWTQFLSMLGTTILGSGGVSGLIIHLWRKRMDQKYEEQMEAIKMKLQRELEDYKAGYRRFLDENSIRFSWWHREQAVYLKNLYVRLSELQRMLRDAVSPYHFNVSQEEKQKMGDAFLQQYQDCETYYRTQKVFLSSTQIEYFDIFFKTVQDALKEHSRSKNDPRESLKHSDMAFEIANSLEACMDKICNSFRCTLQGKSEKSEN